MATLRTAGIPRHALIVEDLVVAASWLRDAVLLAFPGITTTTATTFAEGRRCLHHCQPDFALINQTLPDGPSPELIAECRGLVPPVPAVVTTVLCDGEHLLPALSAGACGYLLKDESREGLALQLRAMIAAAELTTILPSTRVAEQPEPPQRGC